MPMWPTLSASEGRRLASRYASSICFRASGSNVDTRLWSRGGTPVDGPLESARQPEAANGSKVATMSKAAAGFACILFFLPERVPDSNRPPSVRKKANKRKGAVSRKRLPECRFQDVVCPTPDSRKQVDAWAPGSFASSSLRTRKRKDWTSFASGRQGHEPKNAKR